MTNTYQLSLTPLEVELLITALETREHRIRTILRTPSMESLQEEYSMEQAEVDEMLGRLRALGSQD